LVKRPTRRRATRHSHKLLPGVDAHITDHEEGQMRLRHALLTLLVPALAVLLLAAACESEQMKPGVGVTEYGPGTTLTPSSFAPISSATPAPSPTAAPSAVSAAEGTAAAGSGNARQLTEVAKDNVFETKEYQVQVNQTVRLTFQNQGAAIHNWHLMGVQSANGTSIETKLVPGGQQDTITFVITKPGTYKFQCDVHPTEMTGQIVVS
jgi:plastocyanin